MTNTVNDLHNNFRGVMVVASIISITLYLFIASYLVKLESTGCECAMDWRRQYILFFCGFMTVYAIVDLAVLIFKKDAFSFLRPMKVAMTPIVFVLLIIFIITTFQYIHKLKKEKCDCSEDIAQTILLFVAAIDAAIFAVVGVLLLASLVAFILR